MRGSPYIMHLISGLSTPNVTRLGVDFTGTIETVGKNVKRFKPNDEVFGERSGGLRRAYNCL